MKVVTVEQMRALEQRMAERGVPEGDLLQRAGLALAEAVERWVGPVQGRRVLVLAGPGNNGGDGLVAGRHLQTRGAVVVAYLWRRRPDDRHVEEAKQAGVRMITADADPGFALLREEAGQAKVVLDALFGIGISRPFGEDLKTALDRIRTNRRLAVAEFPPDALIQAIKPKYEPLVFAVDVPSGVDADTGKADPAALAADVTITFAFPKVGLFEFPARNLTGALAVADIGIPPALADDVEVEVLSPEMVAAMLPARPLEANKGTFGRALVFAGSLNYVGAAYLSSSAACRAGAGLVTLAMPRTIYPILATKLTETTFEPLDEVDPGVVGEVTPYYLRRLLQRYGYVLIGAGLGQHHATVAFVLSVLRLLREGSWPAVVDADGLNALAKQDRWWSLLPEQTILTPHPGEMARLTGLSVDEVLGNRLGIVREAAKKWRATVILKGADSIVAEPNGRATYNPFADPALASAGTGDVLSGAVLGFLAQRLDPAAAAKCSAFVHGLAGEYARLELGDAGVLAGDLLPRLPLAMRDLRSGAPTSLRISSPHVLWP